MQGDTTLSTALERLESHDHLCLIYETVREQLAVAVPFIRTGLERGDRCVYIADENAALTILEALRDAGVDVDAAAQSGALEILGKRDAYLKEGSFSPGGMIATLVSLAEETKRRGFKTLRATGEMTWALGNEPGVERLIEYEAMLNRYCPAHDVILICQYNKDRFAPEIILDVIHTHPYVIYGETVGKNFYYVPPDEFLSIKREPGREVDRLLGNIVSRDRTENAMRESERRRREIINSTAEGFLMLDGGLRILEVNDSLCAMLGRPRDEITSRTPSDFLADRDAELWRRLAAEAAEKGPMRREMAFQRKDGARVDAIVHAAALADMSGKGHTHFAFLTDITEMKRAQEEVRRKNRILDAINLAQTKFIARTDIRTIFEGLLESALEMTDSRYGFIAEVMYGPDGAPYLKNRGMTNIAWDAASRAFYENHYAEGIEFRELDNLFGAVITNGKTVLADNPATDPRSGGRLPPGHPPLERFCGVPIYSGEAILGMIGLANRPDGYNMELVQSLQPFLSTCANLMEAFRGREKLRLAEEELDRFFEISPDMLCTAGFNGYFRRINNAFTKSLGHRREDLLSKPFMDFVHPDDRQATLYEFSQTRKGREVSHFENRFRCADGSHRWLSWSAVADTAKETVYAAARDVTEKKTHEDALKRSNRDLEELAYVASHDLREPLRMITGYLELLRKRYAGKLDRDADEFIGFAVDGAKRMEGLIHDLLAYSRVTSRGKPPARTDANTALEMALANLQVAVTETGAVVRSGPLPEVAADPVQLIQLFQNLIDNAIKFRRADAVPEISISAEAAGKTVRFSLRDNGIGIERKNHERIFTMFQRLHERGEYGGTGIGLAICKRIVERHGGSIWVESGPGKGSVFRFSMPSAGEAHEH